MTDISSYGLGLAQLSENGIQIAENASSDCRLNNAELIVSSPYTRALQTAAIIAKNRQLKIKVELDLHEWIPDLFFRNTSRKEAKQATRFCIEYKGVCPTDIGIKFENLENVFDREKKFYYVTINIKNNRNDAQGCYMSIFT